MKIEFENKFVFALIFPFKFIFNICYHLIMAINIINNIIIIILIILYYILLYYIILLINPD